MPRAEFANCFSSAQKRFSCCMVPEVFHCQHNEFSPVDIGPSFDAVLLFLVRIVGWTPQRQAAAVLAIPSKRKIVL